MIKKYTILVIALLLGTNILLAQSPGNVSTNIKLWLKADADVTGVTPVSAWADQTANGYSASVPANGPDLIPNAINNNPALDFTSSNSEYLQITNGIFGTSTVNDLWVYMISKPDQSQSQSTLFEGLASSEWFATLNPWSTTVYFDFGSNTTGRISGAWGGSFGNFNMWTFGTSTGTSTPNGTRKSIYRDGLMILSNDNNDNGIGNNSNFIIGGGYSSGDGTNSSFDGQISEIIVYTGIPTILEQEKIQSYLSVKYGIMKQSSDNASTGVQDERDYFSSNGSVIWDYSVNTTYHNYVTGIGRDDNSSLDQRKSKNNSTHASVTMDKGGAFGTDLDFLLWGTDGATGVNSSDIPATYTNRSNQVWKVDITGTPGSVSFSIDLANAGLPETGSVGDYALLIDADGTFASGATAHTTGASLSGSVLSFTSVNFTDGDYFAIGINNAVNSGPAGVYQGVKLWLRADKNVTGNTPISAWGDQTLNSFDASVPANGPDLLSNQINFNPVIDFTSSNNEYLQITDGLLGTATVDDFWVYAVSITDNDQNNSLIFENTTNTDGVIDILLPWTGGSMYFDFGKRAAPGRISGAWGSNYGTANMWTFGTSTSTSTPNGTRKTIYRDGLKILSNDDNFAATGTNSNFYIAGGYSNGTPTDNNFDGKLAELIIFTEVPSILDQEKIQSYLSIKYGLMKQSTDNASTAAQDERDYFSSDGTVIWDYSVNSTYHNYVTGIGRDDDSDLDQQKSKNQSSHAVVTIDKGGAFGTDKDFLLWGTNGATSMKSTDLPAGYTNRSNQEWKVELTGTPGTVSLSINIDDAGLYNTGDVADYALLIDADGVFATGATIHTTGASLVGGLLSFTTVNFSDGDYFAIGINNAVNKGPAGVYTDIKLWLRADKEVTGVSPITAWTDQTLNSNDVSVPANGPDLLSNQINFNPALDFTSSNNEYLQINDGLLGTATVDDFWVYAVSITDNDQNNTFIFENTANTDGMIDILLPWTGGSMYFDFGKRAAPGRINGAWGSNYGVANLWTFGTSTSTSTPNGTRKTIYRDGLKILSNDDNLAATGTNSDFYIAGGYQNGVPTDNNFDGKIAELIIFTGVPSILDQEKIQSYLSIKYGLMKHSVDNASTAGTDERDYFSSDGTVIWDYSVNSTYHNYVTGIGRDDDSDLDQQKSKNQSSHAVVTIDKGGAFGTDKDFLLWGTDGATSVNNSDVPAGYTNRSNQIWKVQITGTPGSVSFSIDLANAGLPETGDVADYSLLIDADGVFAAGSTAHTTGASLTGSILSFTGVSFTDGDYFAIGINNAVNTGPAGVYTDIKLWLRADKDVTGATPVSAWADQTLNSNDVSVPANGPDLLSNQINFNPAIDFTSSNDEYMQITNGLFGSATVSDLWVYMVSNSDLNQAQSSVFENFAATGEHFALLSPYSTSIYFDFGSTSSGRISGAWGGSFGTYNMWTFGTSTGTSTPNGTRKTVYRDGNKILSNDNLDDGTGTNANFIIGAGYSNGLGTTSNFDGQIAEIIIFTGVPSILDQEKIQSYLSIKYGLMKQSADNASTAGTDERDYFASDATVIWDYSVNSSYHNYVTGIGRDDDSDLNQQKSKNSSSHANVTMDKGGAFATDKDFLLWGTNGATSMKSTDLPAGYTNRSNQEWKVELTGTPGTVSLSINLDDAGLYNTGDVADYALLIDADGTFATGATIHTTGATLVGGLLSFTNVSFADGDYFAIGINNAVNKGPAGIYDNIKLWLRADKEVTGASPVSAWNDQTLNSNDVSVPGNGPDLLSNQINFNPAIDFTSANTEYMQITDGLFGTATLNDLWIYAVSRTDIDQNNTLLFENTSQTDGSLNILHPWSGGNMYFDFGQRGGAGRINGLWGSSFGTYNLWTFASSTGTSTPNGTRKAVSRDGSVFMSNDNELSATGTNSDFIIGGGYSAGSPTSSNFDGQLAELIVYTGIPTSLDQEKILTYLSLKYGITKTSANKSGSAQDERDYFASDNTVIWDYSANVGYNAYITGIGRDDDSDLSQQKSINQSDHGAVTMDKGGVFANNFDFLLWANNAQQSVDENDIPATYSMRSKRVWKVKLSGAPGNVSFSIDLDKAGLPETGSVGDYALLIDADGTFAAGATIHTTGASLSGSILSFTGVSFSDGDFFAIGINNASIDGVAGISKGLILWLRADKNVTGGASITEWKDNSINGYALTSPGNNPSLLSSSMNYNPAINFDRANSEYMQLTSGLIGAGTYDDMWIYIVSNSDDDVNGQTLLFENAESSREWFSIMTPYGSNSYFDFGDYSSGRISGAWGGTLNMNHLWSFTTSTGTSTPNGTRKATYRDGKVILSNDNNFSFTGNNSNFLIGGGYSNGSGTTNNYDGRISEIAVYTEIPSIAEQEIIFSYLALKYGVTKNSVDNGGTVQDERDYFASDGTVMWDYSTAASYTNDVIGIMRDDVSDFMQKQSITQDDSIAIYVSSLASSNPSNSGTITNDISSVIISHNAGILQGDTTLSKPEGIYTRFERVWRIVNTNFSDNYSFEIEWDEVGAFDINDIRLLMDTDDDFSNATILSSADGLTFTEGSIIISGISTTQVPLNSTRYFTVASITKDTPLPIELIKFTAKQNRNSVLLNWSTATETNNDYFTIERSADGYQFEAIASIEGAGNSSTANNYETIDNFPINGINYYRLKQTDYDGKFSYSQLVYIEMGLSNELKLYPNPTNGIVKVEGNINDLKSIRILNMLGQDVSSQTIFGKLSSDFVIIDLSNLPKGIYFIRINTKVSRVYKE